jgi:hypothetical protein
MPDFKTSGSKVSAAPVEHSDRAQWSTNLDAFLETSMKTSAKADEMESGSDSSEDEDEAPVKLPYKARLLSNVIEARAYDHGLSAGTGRPLSSFKVEKQLLPLTKTQTRYYIPADQAPGFDPEEIGKLPAGCVPQRACIEDSADGSRSLETAGGRDQNVLFTVPDQGPCGWPLCFFLYFSVSLAGWFHGDTHHRTWGDIRLAYKHAGVWLVVLELALACNVFSGPFEGNAWWAEISEACRYFSQIASWADNLFQFFYDRICRDLMKGFNFSILTYTQPHNQNIRIARMCYLFETCFGLSCYESHWASFWKHTHPGVWFYLCF